MEDTMHVAKIALDPDDVFDAAEAAIDPFASLVASLDPSEAEASTGDGTWTTSDVAAHVLTLFGRSRMADGPSPTPRDLDALNQRAIDALDDRDPASLARGISTYAAKSLEALRRVPPDTPFPFHAGVTGTVLEIGCVALGEFLVHGHDIALAIGRPWDIDPDHARIVTLGTAALIEGWLAPDRSNDATIAVMLGSGGPTIAYDFRSGGIRVGLVEPSLASTTVDPVDFMLAFPFKRLPSPHPVVDELRARVVPI